MRTDKENNKEVSKETIIKNLEELKPRLYDKYSINRIGLFGSFAIGKNTEKSDIDIIIDYEKPIGWEFFDIQDLLYQHLNRKIDLVSFKALKKQLKEKILNQTIFI